MEIAMKIMTSIVAASFLVLSASSGTLLAQNQEPTAPQKNESKMDPKGVPGSTDTQGGKSPSDTSGASGTSGTSASDQGTPKSAQEVTKSRDESKMDPKGIPGSQNTESGKQPATKQ
jgi:hypothetical protein